MVTTSTAQGTCPKEWFNAEIVYITDKVTSPSIFSVTPDTSLTYFKDILGFSSAQIETATKEAINFYRERYGLDFSQSAVNQLGQRTFQNATMSPFKEDDRIMNIGTINQYITTGQTTNVCFRVRAGGYIVNFQGNQLLRGTYGGQQGISAGLSVLISAGYYHIPTPLRKYRTFSLVQYVPYGAKTAASSTNMVHIIQFQSNTPIRTEPIDGTGIIHENLIHSQLGNGVAQGSFRVTDAGNGNILYSARNVFTFPAHFD